MRRLGLWGGIVEVAGGRGIEWDRMMLGGTRYPVCYDYFVKGWVGMGSICEVCSFFGTVTLPAETVSLLYLVLYRIITRLLLRVFEYCKGEKVLGLAFVSKVWSCTRVVRQVNAHLQAHWSCVGQKNVSCVPWRGPLLNRMHAGTFPLCMYRPHFQTIRQS